MFATLFIGTSLTPAYRFFNVTIDANHILLSNVSLNCIQRCWLSLLILKLAKFWHRKIPSCISVSESEWSWSDLYLANNKRIIVFLESLVQWQTDGKQCIGAHHALAQVRLKIFRSISIRQWHALSFTGRQTVLTTVKPCITSPTY